MSSDHRIACGEASTTTNDNVTTTQQQIHPNRRIACGEPSDIDVTLVPQYCFRSVFRLHPETPQRVPGQPRSQNGSKSIVSHKEINSKNVFSCFWKSTPQKRMRRDEARGGHLASSGVIIWPHLAGSGFIKALSGLIWLHLPSSGVIWYACVSVT